jgi:hypothetical protein
MHKALAHGHVTAFRLPFASLPSPAPCRQLASPAHSHFCNRTLTAVSANLTPATATSPLHAIPSFSLTVCVPVPNLQAHYTQVLHLPVGSRRTMRSGASVDAALPPSRCVFGTRFRPPR